MFEKYSMIVIYFGILMVLGFIASKRVHSMSDFVIGGKTLSFWVAAFSAQATGESAWLLLGLTGMGAMVGFSAYWVVVGELLGVWFAWFLMATRFKRLTDKYDSITVIDYLVNRFKSKTNFLRVLSAVSLIGIIKPVQLLVSLLLWSTASPAGSWPLLGRICFKAQ
jgi:sodium/proline symporter